MSHTTRKAVILVAVAGLSVALGFGGGIWFGRTPTVAQVTAPAAIHAAPAETGRRREGL